MLYSFEQLQRGDGNIANQQLSEHIQRHHYNNNKSSKTQNIAKLIIAEALLFEYKSLLR